MTTDLSVKQSSSLSLQPTNSPFHDTLLKHVRSIDDWANNIHRSLRALVELILSDLGILSCFRYQPSR